MNSWFFRDLTPCPPRADPIPVCGASWDIQDGAFSRSATNLHRQTNAVRWQMVSRSSFWAARSASAIASSCLAMGHADSALDWLDNAVDLGFLNHRFLGGIDTMLAPLRGDPRFQALMAWASGKKAELQGRS